jgi:hypothetical protein
MFLLLLAATRSGAQQDEHAHAYASFREAEVEIKDFSFPSLGVEKIRLSEALKDKKIVLIHYFAAWCRNSNYDVVTINELYNKYRDRGFSVIGVCEYSTKDELKKFIEKHKPAYPICIEGEGRKRDRSGTTHFLYRQKINDDRLWGTPLNILLGAEDVTIDNDVIAKRARIAPGELVKTEAEELIREKLSRNQ